MASQVVAVTEAFTVVAGAFVFLRIFTRVSVIRSLTIEDYCIMFSMACSIGMTITICEQVRSGLGEPLSSITGSMRVDSLKAFWASIWLYNLSLTVSKISIVIQYLRAFPSPRFRSYCSILLAIIAAYGAWAFFGSVLTCTPVSFFWNKSVTGGSCLNRVVVWYLNGTVNILTDVAILLLPVPLLRSWDIPRSQRRALMTIMGLGVLVWMVAIIRLPALAKVTSTDGPILHNGPAAGFAAVEINLAIVCACLPALRPLLAHMFPPQFPDLPQRANDEEQPKTLTYPSHTRTNSNNTAGLSTRPSHSRGASNTVFSSNGTEMEEMYQHQASVFGRGSRTLGEIRQVTIGTPQIPTPLPMIPPKLPTLPENLAIMGSVTRPHSREQSTSRTRPSTAHRTHSRGSSIQKPLPVTPFPVINPWNR